MLHGLDTQTSTFSFFKILVSQQTRTLSARHCYMFFFVTSSFSFSPKVLSFLLPLFSLLLLFLLLTLVWLKQSRDQNGPLVGFSASPFPLFYSLQPIRWQPKEEKGGWEQRDNTPLNYSSLRSVSPNLCPPPALSLPRPFRSSSCCYYLPTIPPVSHLTLS